MEIDEQRRPENGFEAGTALKIRGTWSSLLQTTTEGSGSGTALLYITIADEQSCKRL